MGGRGIDLSNAASLTRSPGIISFEHILPSFNSKYEFLIFLTFFESRSDDLSIDRLFHSPTLRLSSSGLSPNRINFRFIVLFQFWNQDEPFKHEKPCALLHLDCSLTVNAVYVRV